MISYMLYTEAVYLSTGSPLSK